MDLDRFIRQDIVNYLDAQQEKDIEIKGIRDEEINLFDIDRDYAKEISQQLKLNNVIQTKEIFTDLIKEYNSIKEGDPVKKKAWLIVKENYNNIKEYLAKHTIDSPLKELIKWLDSKEVFTKEMMPKEIPLKAAPKKEKKKGEDEANNLLKDAEESPITKKMLGKEIAREIPLEELNELSQIFAKAQRPVIIQQPVPGQPPAQPVAAAPANITVKQEASEKSQVAKEGTAEIISASQENATEGAGVTYNIPQPQVVNANVAAPEKQAAAGISRDDLKNILAEVSADFSTNTQKKIIEGFNKEKKDLIHKLKQKEIEIKKKEEEWKKKIAREFEEAEQKRKELEEEREKEKKQTEEIRHKLKQELIEEVKKEERLREEHEDFIKKQEELLKKKIEKDMEDEKQKRSSSEIEKEIKENEREELEDQKFLDLYENVIRDVEKIEIYIDQDNVNQAKDVYLKAKQNFGLLPKSKQKEKLYKEMIVAFRRIKDLEQERKDKKLAKKLHINIQEIKENFDNVTLSLDKGNLKEAEENYVKASNSMIKIQDPENRQIFEEVLMHLKERINQLYKEKKREKILSETPLTIEENEKDGFVPELLKEKLASIFNKPHEAETEDSNKIKNLYEKGLHFLYNHKNEEAAELFQKILKMNPGHMAARIRLREATGGM